MLRTTSEVLFGFPELKDRRQFLLTTSTFAGTGRYASYAVQQPTRSWEALAQTIPHLSSMNMFGIAHVGLDVCGNAPTLDEELCLRWLQLTTFTPLARHSQNGGALSGPLGFTNKEAAKEVLYDRMQYLRLLYTCMYEMSEFGGSCFDPLFFHYSLDVLHFERPGVNDTFIAANAVKVSPVLAPQGANQTFQSHFPVGRWVNLADYSDVVDSKDEMKDLKYGSTVNAHLMPGAIIPIQNVTSNHTIPLTTVDLQALPLTLVINRNSVKSARGTVFLDSGISKSELVEKRYEYYTVEHKSSKSFHFLLTQGKRGAQDSNPNSEIDEVIIADAGTDLVGTDFACAVGIDGSMRELSVNFDSTLKSIRISKMNKFSQKIMFSKVQAIYYGTNGKDLNLCRQSAYEYEIPQDFDLSAVLGSNNGTIPLVHRQGTLPNLSLSLRVYADGVINAKWSWQEQPSPKGKRAHFEVPNDIVDTSRPPRQGEQLGRFVTVQRSPFQLSFTQMAAQKTEPFLHLKNILYDSFLNWVGLQAVTLKDDKFRGVMGLGERSSPSLFYPDGIYSMWATDEPTKAEDGVPPGDQSYGVHPFFMYQNTANHWVGVFFKQAHAQDWHIYNSPWEGLVNLKSIATGGIADMYVLFNA
jgi:alpha-glucosidase (family GH31 glycosyl hydrolase)